MHLQRTRRPADVDSVVEGHRGSASHEPCHRFVEGDVISRPAEREGASDELTLQGDRQHRAVVEPGRVRCPSWPLNCSVQVRAAGDGGGEGGLESWSLPERDLEIVELRGCGVRRRPCSNLLAAIEQEGRRASCPRHNAERTAQHGVEDRLKALTSWSAHQGLGDRLHADDRIRQALAVTAPVGLVDTHHGLSPIRRARSPVEPV
ncbi:hypothetical protein GCM10023199_40420 [Actinomycetospora chibensis]